MTGSRTKAPWREEEDPEREHEPEGTFAIGIPILVETDQETEHEGSKGEQPTEDQKRGPESIPWHARECNRARRRLAA